MKVAILLMIGIWLGMVLGLSFIEAPLKFRAPNITLTLGLGIGKLVFTTLNRIEICFSLLLLFWIITEYANLKLVTLIGLICLLFFVVLQSIWLLPILNVRVDKIMNGIEVAHSNHHFYFVAIEILKTILLVYSFFKIYQHE